MKRLIYGGLSILLMGMAIAPAASAQMRIDNDSQLYLQPEARRVSAFELVSQAFRGEFSEYGIPSYGYFLSAYRTGELDAEEVIRTAVEANWLSPMAIYDQDYESAVAAQLDSLGEAYD